MINNRQNGRRRGRGGGGPRPNGPNNNVDRGNRIDNRARGNANQLHEKYKTLARDAQTQGDRVMTEYYLQFADHYFRVLNESRSRFEDQRRPREDAEDFGDEGEAANDFVNEPVAAAPAVETQPDGELDLYGAPASNGQDSAETVRPTRGRRRGGEVRREAVSSERVEERIEIDRLPPALVAAVSDDEPVDEQPKPKRRGRPRKTEAAAEA